MPAVITGAHSAAADPVLDPERLAALEATGLLDAVPEEAFDRITELVQRTLGVPVALVSLVDAERQVFKSQQGLAEPWASARQTPLSHSFCQHVVATGHPLVVDDAPAHPLVCGNEAIADLGVEAYLGVPIRTPDGQTLGSLCAIDSTPRTWTADDQKVMTALAAAVEAEIALREQLAERALAEAAARRAEALARTEAEALATVVGVNAALAAELDPDRLVQAVVDAGRAVTRAAFGAFFYSPGRGAGSALLFAVSGAPRAAFERLGAVRMTPLFEPSFSGREAVRSDDVRADPRYGQQGGMPAGHLPVRSYLSVPVLGADGSPLGALLFGHPEPGVFDAQAERTAEAIATQAAIALQNARLHHALDESERRHRMVLANLNDVVFQTDRDGRYTYLNAAWEAKTGHAVAGAIGRHCFAFSTGDVEALAALVLDLTEQASAGDASAGEDQTFQIPVQVLHADGSTLHFEANWRPAFDESGAHAGWAGTYTDVTDTVRYHAERRAREAAEAAQVEAERMARLQSAFLSNMSHEIRTPLTAVLGFAELLDEEVPDDLRDLTGSVLSGGRRLMATLNAVLDLAQIEAGQMAPAPRPVDLRAFAEAAVRDVRPLAEAKGIAVEADVPEGLPLVLLDAGLAERVVGNLLGNAVKFTERGGVTLSVRLEAADGISAAGGISAGVLRLDVSDTGIGIAPEAVPHVFDEFQQASDGYGRTHEGNGLGLAIVERVAALLGGSVTVESEVGVGSRFCVCLRARVAGHPQVAEDALSASEASRELGRPQVWRHWSPSPLDR